MKRRTTLFTLATLLSAGFGIQAQNLSRQPLSSITLQNAPCYPPQATSEETDQIGWLWKQLVNKVFDKGEWLTQTKTNRTFDENDRIATQTIFNYDKKTCEIIYAHRTVYQYDSNGYCIHSETFESNDGVNFTLSTVSDSEADPIFTQTWTSGHVIHFNTETNQWEEQDAMTWWKDVKRDNEGRITEVVDYQGVKPDMTSIINRHKFYYKDGERAPYEMVFFNCPIKNIKWHESDGNFINLGNNLAEIFFDFDDYTNNNISKNNKPIRYEAYDTEGNWLLTNQYTYQADGSYDKKTENNNATLLLKHTVLDQYGSYERTKNFIENQKYSKVFERKLFNEQGHQIAYEYYIRQDKDESTGNWDKFIKYKYTNTYENGVLTAVKVDQYNSTINNDFVPYQLTEYSDFHKPQTGIDSQTAANDLNVVFINNCLQLNLPVGTSYILCDIQGRVITSGNEAPEQLDLNSYTNGVYLFKVKTKDGRQQCFKLMKH